MFSLSVITEMTKSKYDQLYIPLSTIQNININQTYTQHFNERPTYDKNMEPFNIVHYYEQCVSEPRNVTYMLQCPECSLLPVDTVTYCNTNYSKLRFYVFHNNNCRIKKCKYISHTHNLICDQCWAGIY